MNTITERERGGSGLENFFFFFNELILSLKRVLTKHLLSMQGK